MQAGDDDDHAGDLAEQRQIGDDELAQRTVAVAPRMTNTVVKPSTKATEDSTTVV